MEPYLGRLLVCLREFAAISVHSAPLVREAFDLVSISLASESDRAEPHTDPSGSLWGVEFPGKEFLRVRSSSLCARRDSRRCCRRSRPLSRRSLAVFQVPDWRFHRLLRGRRCCAAVDVQPSDGPGKKEGAGGLWVFCSAIRRKLRSKMGAGGAPLPRTARYGRYTVPRRSWK